MLKRKESNVYKAHKLTSPTQGICVCFLRGVIAHECIKRDAKKEFLDFGGMELVGIFKRFFLFSCSFPLSCKTKDTFQQKDQPVGIQKVSLSTLGYIVQNKSSRLMQRQEREREERKIRANLTLMRPASAAPGCVAESPSWLFPPQTGVSSLQVLCTELLNSSSSVHDAAPAETRMH